MPKRPENAVHLGLTREHRSAVRLLKRRHKWSDQKLGAIFGVKNGSISTIVTASRTKEHFAGDDIALDPFYMPAPAEMNAFLDAAAQVSILVAL